MIIICIAISREATGRTNTERRNFFLFFYRMINTRYPTMPVGNYGFKKYHLKRQIIIKRNTHTLRTMLDGKLEL